MAIKKNDFGAIKKKFSTSAKYKPQRFFDLGTEFLDACGLPGPAIGHLNMLLGHSDVGKTTAMILTAIDAQKKVFYLFLLLQNKNGVLTMQNLWVLNVNKYWMKKRVKLIGMDFSYSITTSNISNK
jgi:hypothetical protein